MIVLDKDSILEDYFIDENSVITDKNGNVQKQYLSRGRYFFKRQYVHKIMLNTFIGIKDGDYVVHHLDENPLNNKLSNLVYLTRKDHTQLHNKGKVGTWKGKHHTEQAKYKQSITKLGEKNPNYGKHWWTDGIKNICAKECPQGFVAGRIKR